MNGAGLLHGLAAAGGAAQAVHADGQEDGGGVGSDIQDITDDGVFGNVDHGIFLHTEFIDGIILYCPCKFNRKYVPFYFLTDGF